MFILQHLADSCVRPGGVEVAAMNIASTVGLPGAEKVDAAGICRTLDVYKEEVEAATAKYFPKFRGDPARCENSEGKFRMEVLVTVLQQNNGFRYDPSLMKKVDFFRDSSKVFLHGVMETRKGTCANLPVLYVAVGRRLGYPLKLVASKWHLFARWDGQGDRFNIECTTKGFISRPDEHYLNYPESTSKEKAEEYGFLKSKSPREELALFFNNRACCLQDNGNYRGTVHAFAWATELEPTNILYSGNLCQSLRTWRTKLDQIWPKPFPTMRLNFPSRVFKNIPERLEADIYHLCAADEILRDVNNIQRWWGPVRRGERPKDYPGQIEVKYFNYQDFKVTFTR